MRESTSSGWIWQGISNFSKAVREINLSEDAKPLTTSNGSCPNSVWFAGKTDPSNACSEFVFGNKGERWKKFNIDIARNNFANKIINSILDFLNKTENNRYLFDFIAKDLKINIDYELSNLYDMVKEKHISASFEDVVIATKKRIIVSIESFIEDKQ